MAASASCSTVSDSCEDSTFVLVGKLNPRYVFVFPTLDSFSGYFGK